MAKKKPNGLKFEFMGAYGIMDIMPICKAEKRPRSLNCKFFKDMGYSLPVCKYMTRNYCTCSNAILEEVGNSPEALLIVKQVLAPMILTLTAGMNELILRARKVIADGKAEAFEDSEED